MLNYQRVDCPEMLDWPSNHPLRGAWRHPTSPGGSFEAMPPGPQGPIILKSPSEVMQNIHNPPGLSSDYMEVFFLFMGKSSINRGFFIAVFDYQMVPATLLWKSSCHHRGWDLSSSHLDLWGTTNDFHRSWSNWSFEIRTPASSGIPDFETKPHIIPSGNLT